MVNKMVYPLKRFNLIPATLISLGSWLFLHGLVIETELISKP